MRTNESFTITNPHARNLRRIASELDLISHAADRVRENGGEVMVEGGLLLNEEYDDRRGTVTYRLGVGSGELRITFNSREMAWVKILMADVMREPRVAFGESAEPRCQYCDGTGDVHRADGEWLGTCHCAMRNEPAPVQDERDHQIRLLGQALGECISAAGIIRPNASLSGPELLMFADDLKHHLAEQARPAQTEQTEQQTEQQPVAWLYRGTCIGDQVSLVRVDHSWRPQYSTSEHDYIKGLPLYAAPVAQAKPEVNAVFEYAMASGVTATMSADVKRVEHQDDGSLTVVIDYWPENTEHIAAKRDSLAANVGRLERQCNAWMNLDTRNKAYIAKLQRALEAATKPTPEPALTEYDIVLQAFLPLMFNELRANDGKGGRRNWLSMSRQDCLLELHYHLAKLQKATLDDAPSGIREHAADVANMSMMLVDICGLLTAEVGSTYTTRAGESVMGIANRELRSSERWTEIRDLNADAFPDIGPHDYYPIGTVLKMPAKGGAQ